MNMDVAEEARNQAMSQGWFLNSTMALLGLTIDVPISIAMLASRSAIIAHVHLSHFASTFVMTLPCNLFVDALVLMNGVTRGLKPLSLDEIQTLTRKAIEMLWDPRWSVESRPMEDTARTLQTFYEECFGKPFDDDMKGQQRQYKQYHSGSP